MCMNMCIKMCTEVLVHLVDCVQQQQPYICYVVPTYVHRQARCVVQASSLSISLHIWLCVCMYVCIFANIELERWSLERGASIWSCVVVVSCVV